MIDDAIVVMENIFRYIEEKKYTPYEAAMAATGEIGLAVMAITLSLVAVFLPIAMMEGIVGRFLKSFGITMAATILVSMLVSFTLTPMLAARWFKRPDDRTTLSGRGAGVRAGARAAPSPYLAGEGTEASHGGSKGQVFYRAIESVYLVAAAVFAAAALGGGAGRRSAAWPRCPCCSKRCPRTSFPTTTRRSSN